MEFSRLKQLMELEGWRVEPTLLTAPSGDYWVSDEPGEDWVERYLTVARRAEQSRAQGRTAQAAEFDALLRALAADEGVAAMLRHFEAVSEVVRRWSTCRGLALSFWDFSRPSVRATARHPAGGIACIECIAEPPAGVLLLAYHWVDDLERSTRTSWVERWPLGAFEAERLRDGLEHALERLMAPPSPSDYRTSTIAAGATELDQDRAYEDALPLLRRLR